MTSKSSSHPHLWDVIVVGAGPAGATAARTAAEMGCRTLLLERAVLPRYKTCGGGLVGASVAALPAGFRIPSRDHINQISISCHSRGIRTLSQRDPVVTMVYRDEFDAALTRSATEAGAELRERVQVKSVATNGETAVVTTNGGQQLRARSVVGADGSTSRIACYVGVRCEQVDLALEAEVPVASDETAAWKGRVLLDWGPIPGSYGWVFPKGNHLTIGVISARGHPHATRAYMNEFLASHHLSNIENARTSGHLTRCRLPDSPLSRGRVLVAGDAAGLLDPMFREGISFALRSGALAGHTAAAIATANDGQLVRETTDSYARQINDILGTEMLESRKVLTLFKKHPRLVHTGLTRVPAISNKLFDYAAGRATIPELLDNTTTQIALALASRP